MSGPPSPARDGALRSFAGVGAFVVNASIFLGMAYAGMRGAPPPPLPELPSVSVELVALPILGKEREPDQLPRIVQPPPPPEPETDAVNLARKKAEEEEEVKKKKQEEEKKKRELAEEKRRLEEQERKLAEKKKKEEETKQRKARDQAMRRALNRVADVRADEDSPEGFAQGDALGTSSDPRSLLAKNAYANLLSTVLQRQFEVPATLSPADRRRLEAHVHLRIAESGKLIGEPRLAKPSGNRFFDEAALRAAKKFGPGSDLKLPLPPASEKQLRRLVLKDGVTARMNAK